MRKLLIFQHVPHEILGTLNPLLKRSGFRIRYVNFGRHPDAHPSLEGYHGLVLLGGPMSVYHDHLYRHLTTEMKLIEDAMKRNLPNLGSASARNSSPRHLGPSLPKSAEGNRLVRSTQHDRSGKKFNVKVAPAHRKSFPMAWRYL
jgi:hypothetical protein